MRRVPLHRSTYRMFCNTVLTMATVEFTQVGAGFIDGLITGKYMDSAALSAIGLIYPFFSLMGLLSGLLTAGSEVKCTSLMGAGELRKCNGVLNLALVCGFAVSALATAGCLMFSAGFASLLGAVGDALLAAAERYLTGLAIGTVPLVLNPIVSMALTLVGKGRTVRVSAVVCAGANIGLDLLAVLRGWGIFGIGLSTAAGQGVQLLMLAIALMRDSAFHFSLRGLPVRALWDIAVYGSEKVVRRLANVIRPIVLNRFILSLGGTAAISALSVHHNIGDFAVIPFAGISAAVGLLTGIFWGEVNRDEIRAVGGFAHRAILLFAVPIGGALWLFRAPIAVFYARDPETAALIVFAIGCLAPDLPLKALVDARISYLQAIKRPKTASTLLMLNRLVFPVVSAALLGLLFGARGVLASVTVSDGLTALAVFAAGMIRKKGLPTADESLMLGAGFDIPPEHIIDLTVRDAEELSLTAWQLQLFCKGHRFDERKAMWASMCLEDLVGAIRAHPSRRAEPISVRVTLDNDGRLIIRTRDSCDPFNVLQYMRDRAAQADRDSAISTAILDKTTQEVGYLRSINTNVYVLKI